MFESVGKIVLVLIAGSLSFLLVSLPFGKHMSIAPAASAALVGAAVGVGGLRLCLLMGTTSSWLVIPTFLVIACVGLVAGTCVANAVAPAIPARYEDWDVGLGLFSIVWAIYSGAGTLLGFIMILCVYIIRRGGVP